jgi:hypothetical protein
LHETLEFKSTLDLVIVALVRIVARDMPGETTCCIPPAIKVVVVDVLAGKCLEREKEFYFKATY